MFGYGVRITHIGKRYTGALPKFIPTRSTTTPCSYVARISPITTEVVAAVITIDSECSPFDLQIAIFGLCL